MKLLRNMLIFFFNNNSQILENLVNQSLKNVGERANWKEIMKLQK